MLIVLSGITGAGKSFFKNKIVEELEFQNLPIVTTRTKRQGEIDGIDKEFVTEKIFAQMKQQGIFQIDFEYLGAHYGYRKEYLQSKENQVTELHYPMIYAFKKHVKNLFAIDIVPDDVERAKTELENRHLPNEIFQKRLQEIDEHIKKFANDFELQQQFDYILHNDYTEKSNRKLIEIIKNKIESEEKICAKK